MKQSKSMFFEQKSRNPLAITAIGLRSLANYYKKKYDITILIIGLWTNVVKNPYIEMYSTHYSK